MNAYHFSHTLYVIAEATPSYSIQPSEVRGVVHYTPCISQGDPSCELQLQVVGLWVCVVDQESSGGDQFSLNVDAEYAQKQFLTITLLHCAALVTLKL